MTSLTDQPGADWRRKHEEILAAAARLFERDGYEGTTMKNLAAEAGCSVGYLYKHFAGKQELLDGLMLMLLGTYEELRRRTREQEGRRGLDCLRRELELFCHHLVDHRALIPVFAERQPHCSAPLAERLARLHREDQELLAAARSDGTVPDMDPALMAAVLDGAVWSVLKLYARTDRRESFLLVPRVVDQLVFRPMEDLARPQGRPEESRT